MVLVFFSGIFWKLLSIVVMIERFIFVWCVSFYSVRLDVVSVVLSWIEIFFVFILNFVLFSCGFIYFWCLLVCLVIYGRLMLEYVVVKLVRRWYGVERFYFKLVWVSGVYFWVIGVNLLGELVVRDWKGGLVGGCVFWLLRWLSEVVWWVDWLIVLVKC